MQWDFSHLSSRPSTLALAKADLICEARSSTWTSQILQNLALLSTRGVTWFPFLVYRTASWGLSAARSALGSQPEHLHQYWPKTFQLSLHLSSQKDLDETQKQIGLGKSNAALRGVHFRIKGHTITVTSFVSMNWLHPARGSSGLKRIAHWNLFAFWKLSTQRCRCSSFSGLPDVSIVSIVSIVPTRATTLSRTFCPALG